MSFVTVSVVVIVAILAGAAGWFLRQQILRRQLDVSKKKLGEIQILHMNLQHEVFGIRQKLFETDGENKKLLTHLRDIESGAGASNADIAALNALKAQFAQARTERETLLVQIAKLQSDNATTLNKCKSFAKEAEILKDEVDRLKNENRKFSAGLVSIQHEGGGGRADDALLQSTIEEQREKIAQNESVIERFGDIEARYSALLEEKTEIVTASDRLRKETSALRNEIATHKLDKEKLKSTLEEFRRRPPGSHDDRTLENLHREKDALNQANETLAIEKEKLQKDNQRALEEIEDLQEDMESLRSEYLVIKGNFEELTRRPTPQPAPSPLMADQLRKANDALKSEISRLKNTLAEMRKSPPLVRPLDVTMEAPLSLRESEQTIQLDLPHREPESRMIKQKTERFSPKSPADKPGDKKKKEETSSTGMRLLEEFAEELRNPKNKKDSPEP